MLPSFASVFPAVNVHPLSTTHLLSNKSRFPFWQLLSASLLLKNPVINVATEIMAYTRSCFKVYSKEFLPNHRLITAMMIPRGDEDGWAVCEGQDYPASPSQGRFRIQNELWPRARPRRQCNLRGRLYKSSTSPLACRQLVGVVLRNRDGFLVCAENGSYMNASLWFGDFIVPPPAKCQGFLVNLYIYSVILRRNTRNMCE